MGNIVLMSIPIEQLLNEVRKIVKEEIAAASNNEVGEKLLTTHELCKMLSVSPVTISTWASKGKIKKYTIGGRNRYKHSEIMESLQTLKKYGHG